jgi:hypothetical protein
MLSSAGRRFVVLHQPSEKSNPQNYYNPFTWRNVAPSARHGMTESDAYGKAVDFMQSLVRQQQAQAVRNPVPRWKRYGSGKGKPAYFPKVETFSRDAPWRKNTATDSQLKTLERLGVSVDCSSGGSSSMCVFKQHVVPCAVCRRLAHICVNIVCSRVTQQPDAQGPSSAQSKLNMLAALLPMGSVMRSSMISDTASGAENQT